MEGDGEKPPSPKPEAEETSIKKHRSKKARNLKEATTHLKEEALRRYRLRHVNDTDDEESEKKARSDVTSSKREEPSVQSDKIAQSSRINVDEPKVAGEPVQAFGNSSPEIQEKDGSEASERELDEMVSDKSSKLGDVLAKRTSESPTSAMKPDIPQQKMDSSELDKTPTSTEGPSAALFGDKDSDSSVLLIPNQSFDVGHKPVGSPVTQLVDDMLKSQDVEGSSSKESLHDTKKPTSPELQEIPYSSRYKKDVKPLPSDLEPDRQSSGVFEETILPAHIGDKQERPGSLRSSPETYSESQSKTGTPDIRPADEDGKMVEKKISGLETKKTKKDKDDKLKSAKKKELRMTETKDIEKLIIVEGKQREKLIAEEKPKTELPLPFEYQKQKFDQNVQEETYENHSNTRSDSRQKGERIHTGSPQSELPQPFEYQKQNFGQTVREETYEHGSYVRSDSRQNADGMVTSRPSSAQVEHHGLQDVTSKQDKLTQSTTKYEETVKQSQDENIVPVTESPVIQTFTSEVQYSVQYGGGEQEGQGDSGQQKVEEEVKADPEPEQQPEPEQAPEQAQENGQEKTEEQVPEAKPEEGQSEDASKPEVETSQKEAEGTKPEEQEKVPEQTESEQKPTEVQEEGEQKPTEQTEEEKPTEPTEGEQKPSEQVEGEQKPTEQAEGEQKPSEQADGEQKPSEQAEGEKKPSEQTEEEQKPDQTEGEQKPTEQAEGEQKPTEQAEGEQKPSEQAEGEQKPTEQTEGEQKPTEQAEGEQKPTEQAEGDQKPTEQSESEQKPSEQAEGDGVIPDAISYQKAFQSEEGSEKPEEKKPDEQAEGEKTEGDTNENAATKQEKEDEAKEGEEVEGQTESEKEEPGIPADFFYNYDDMISRAVVTAESGLPEDLLLLQHMFGYDCTKRANLHMLDDRTVVFAAGNLVQILDLQTKEQKYIRSTSGGGIGAITVHPSKKYFVVAEKGDAPNINIFEYPSLKLYRILRGGTQKSYSYVDFSADGELLASQGGDPDFMLTVWNWKQEQTVLRSKAFSQDVFRATFSTELEGQLTTAGTGHIRFWKMADTFTGLKLQGELGKFGKTEITDIEGYVELPDGKVLSGSEWGNMLLWDGGLIKVEIGRKNKKSCHNGDITQILLDEGELMTIGIDGYIRVWDFESIDTADSTDESGLFEMEPMNELRVGSDVHLRSITKSVDAENEVTNWYAQDSNGGIWKLDLSFSHTSMAPEKLFTYHAGPILGCDISPITHLVATTGTDHTVRVFDYVQRKQLHEARFPAGGSCLKWVPQIVDPKGATFLTGFQDGVLRIFKIGNLSEESSHRRHKHDCDLDLKQVFKPHNKKITAMAIDSKGEILATGAEDNTIFFMSVGEKYEAIGFIETPAAVRQLQWSPDKFSKTTLLAFCDDGIVLEIEAPDSTNIDTAHTYRIPDLRIRMQKFKSIKSRIRHEEDLKRKEKEEEERKKREEEERRKRIERGLETESEQGDEEEEKEEGVTKYPRGFGKREEEWKPFIPDEPSPILDGFYTEEGQFWLSMGGFDAGYLYEYKFVSEEEREKLPEEMRDEPIRVIPVEDSMDVPIHKMKFSLNGKQMLFGMENGSIRIQNLETENDLSAMGPFWNLTMHDNDYGHITGLCPSFDGKMLLTVGADGNFFLFNYMEQEKIEEKVKENKAKLPSARKGDWTRIDDIDDPHAYSIEDAKQKAEHDKMMKQAEEKKRDVRRLIAKLRRQFKTLLEKNETLPTHLQLKKDEFEMDREIKIELQQQKENRIETVRKELAWEAEKQRIALEKLRKRFKDVVECERIVVIAFQTQHEVSSFRAAKLSDDFYQMKADFERRRTMTFHQDMTRDPTRDLMTGQTGRMTDTTGTGGEKTEEQAAKVTTTLKGSMGERITKALNKVEEKKKKRAARKAQWEELYNTKPADDYEDPEDVGAIKEAKDNMGDYKLKTAQDYVVPDHLRMNVEKARGRLLILKDLIHENKYNFNLRLLSLRDKKIHVIEEIRDLVSQLEDIQTKLSPDKHLAVPPVPEMYPVEMPERKLEYTRETLLVFKKEYEARKAAASKSATDGGGFGGFGGFGGGGEQTKAPSPPPTAKPGTAAPSEISKADKAGETGIMEEIDENLTPLELQIKQAEEIRLIYEQDRILKKIEELLKNFDAELRLLRHDKFKLDIVMKNADLRQVTLFEEFVLLKEYEKREDLLAERVTSKQQEKLDMHNKVLEVQSKSESKKKEIEKLQEKERQLYATFMQSLGDNNKFGDYLTKVFKKRIKRAKKKTTEEGESDEDSDEDSDDDSDWDEDEDESDEEAGGFDLDICPPGCDQNLYDNTCQLREKRLDIEEALAEEKKNNEALKKEVESLNKKSKVIDSALKTAQNDLEAFQLEKQQKLNDLDVVVTLKLHQIQYMINGILPQDLSQTLVFESNGVTRLQQRIKELEHEKHLQKKHMKESRRKHVQLIKDRKVFEQKLIEMEEQCNSMMIGKFGRIVDLEKLETITFNRSIEEQKERLRLTEIQCSEEQLEWDEKIKENKNRITALIRDNTNKLDQLNLLLGEKKNFEGSLDGRQKNLGEEYSGARKSDVREKQRLIQLVQLQAQEIDALKEEIMLLSRKGGHILPPAQPPLPQSPANMRTISN